MVRNFTANLAKNVQTSGRAFKDYAANKFADRVDSAEPENLDHASSLESASGTEDTISGQQKASLFEAIRAKAADSLASLTKNADEQDSTDDDQEEGWEADADGQNEATQDSGEALFNKRRKLRDMCTAAQSDYNLQQETTLALSRALYQQRERASDLIKYVEHLINTIANSPKEFEREIAEVKVHRSNFEGLQEIDRKNLQDLRQSGGALVAGVGAAAVVASLAPSAAMWAATTFGVASTGTAISTLSGAAATSASLAWIGGGALAAGGSGAAGGAALLALAGPIGWSIAGATVLGTAATLTVKRMGNTKLIGEQLTELKGLIQQVRGTNEEIGALIQESDMLRTQLEALYLDAIVLTGSDFSTLEQSDRRRLSVLVNNVLSCARHLSVTVEMETRDKDEEGSPKTEAVKTHGSANSKDAESTAAGTDGNE